MINERLSVIVSNFIFSIYVFFFPYTDQGVQWDISFVTTSLPETVANCLQLAAWVTFPKMNFPTYFLPFSKSMHTEN